MKNKLFLGLFLLLVANTIWGLMAPLVKDLLNMGMMTGLTLSAIRTYACGILFWILDFCLPQKITKSESLLRKDFPLLFLGGVLFIVGTQTLTNIGAQYTYAVDAAVCCSVTPLFTLILGAIFYHRAFPPFLKILGVLLGMSGVLVFIFATENNPEMNVTNAFLGDLLCVLSQICGAVYLVFFVKVAGRYSAFTLMKWLYTFAFVVMLPFTIVDVVEVPWANLSYDAWFDLLYIVLPGSFVAYLLVLMSQKLVTPTLIAMCNYIQPLVAAIYAIILGMAVITSANILATILIFVGVWLVEGTSGRIKFK